MSHLPPMSLEVAAHMRRQVDEAVGQRPYILILLEEDRKRYEILAHDCPMSEVKELIKKAAAVIDRCHYNGDTEHP